MSIDKFKHRQVQPKFNLGDKVFAKVKGFCSWPAKIEGVADYSRNQIKYHVYFYGTKQVAICKEKNVRLYTENKYRYGKPKTTKYFNASIEEIEAEIEHGTSESTIPPEMDVEMARLTKGRIMAEKDVHDRLNGIKNMLGLPIALPPEYLALIIEDKLLECQYEIQVNLSTDKANTEICLKYLDELLKLELTSVMIKKHSDVVDFLFQLKSYHGNVEAWPLSKKEKVEFHEQAQVIRNKAQMVLDKIKALFYIPFGVVFEDHFKVEMEQFKKSTAQLSSDAYLALVGP